MDTFEANRDGTSPSNGRGDDSSAGYRFYVYKDGSAFEAETARVLYDEFLKIEAANRPWVGVGLRVRGLRKTREIDFLIISPRSVAAIETKGVRNVETGTVYGHPNWEEWYLTTPDGIRHPIDASSGTPLNQALDAAYQVKENRDRFFDLRGASADIPFIKSILVFPDGYDLSGIQEVALGPREWDSVVAMNLRDLAQASVNGKNDTDAPILSEWIASLIGYQNHASLRQTWLDPTTARPKADAGSENQYRDPENSTSSNDAAPHDSQTAESGQQKSANATSKESSSAFESAPSADTERPSFEDASQETRQTRPDNAIVVTKTNPLVPFLLVGCLGLLLFIAFQMSRPLVHESTNSFTPTVPLAPSEPAQPTDIPPQLPEPAPASPPAPRPTPPTYPSLPRRVPSSSPPPIIQPAEPGMYETLHTATARSAPDDRAEFLDRIPPNTTLRVDGSDGDWLIVRSRSLGKTVYVRRDEARYLRPLASVATVEADPKKIAAEIQASLQNWQVVGVVASFSGNTAFLTGTVKSNYELSRAINAARAIPAVEHVNDAGVRVEP